MRQSMSTQEVTFLSQMIYRINSVDDYESMCNIALGQLKTVIPYTKGIIFQIREQNQKLVYRYPVVANPLGLEYDEDIFIGGTYRSDWLIYASSPWSHTFRGSDIRDDETFRRSSLYQDVYAPQNIYHGLHSIIVHRDHKLAQMGLFRPDTMDDFSDREVFLFSTLTLHLELKLYQLLEKKSASRLIAEGDANYQELENFRFYMMQQYGLTKREIETCLLLYEGKTSKEVTMALFISKSTFDKHLYKVYQKTGVKNRAQLTQMLHREMQIYHEQYHEGRI